MKPKANLFSEGDDMRRKKRDMNILKGLLGFGLLALPWLLLRKRPLKDWLIVFLAKGVYTSILDSLVVKQKRVAYPIRFFGKTFKINILFDYLLFPLVCLFYNQITYHSRLFGILGKALFFSVPMTMMEIGFEKKTKLVTWKKKWSWYHNLLSLTLTFWLDRGMIGLIRKVSNSSYFKREKQD